MDPRCRQPQQHVPGFDRCPGQQRPALDRTDAEAREVVVVRRVHPRHLGRLAADQRAARLAASFGDAGHHTFGDRGIEPPARVIIEEEQRLGALHDEVVGAHRHQIDADAVVPIPCDRQFQLGAHPVVRGHQQRIEIAGGARIEHAAETAQFGVGAGSARRAGKRRDRADQRVAGVRSRRPHRRSCSACRPPCRRA